MTGAGSAPQERLVVIKQQQKMMEVCAAPQEKLVVIEQQQAVEKKC